MIKIDLIRPMVSKVIELSTSQEVIVDYEMYELLRTNNLLFNTMYVGCPMQFDSNIYLSLESLDKYLDYYPKEHVDTFKSFIGRYGDKVYIYSTPEIDFAFCSHWEEDKMFFVQWYTDAGDSSKDYDPIIITTVKYQHEVETLISLNKSFSMWFDCKPFVPPLKIQNEE